MIADIAGKDFHDRAISFQLAARRRRLRCRAAAPPGQDKVARALARDIALALGDLIGESAHALDLQNEAFRQFLAGYRAIRAMNDAALHHLPLFIQAANLYTFARLYRALTPVNEAGELPWMAGLRDKLAAKMAFIRDDLAHGLPVS